HDGLKLGYGLGAAMLFRKIFDCDDGAVESLVKKHRRAGEFDENWSSVTPGKRFNVGVTRHALAQRKTVAILSSLLRQAGHFVEVVANQVLRTVTQQFGR